MQRVLLVLGLGVLSAALASAQAQPNHCAECHLAHPTARGRGHVLDWSVSAHKRSEIGCERCHGGDPAAHEVLRAHFGVTSLRHPASPLNRRNVPATCGTCHSGPYSAFQKSGHAALLRAGDSRGPTCVTCHGEAAAQLLSPDAIAAECSQCHGAGKRAPRAERAADVRQWLERVREVRAQLAAVRPMIDAVRDAARQKQLRDAYRQAEAPLAQSVEKGHSFVFAESNERLNVARQRTAALYQSIIGAPSR
jgi:Cytochrome c7 and related cytochrome c/Cytochrome c554 and c-prime